MNLSELFRQTFSSIFAHKMRSFLTMFGIIWGIASVILLVGLGRGFNKDQKDRLKTIGVDLAIIWGGRTSAQAGGFVAGRQILLSVDDAIAIKNECYLIKTVSPELRRGVSEVSAYNAASRAVRGVWPEYQRFRSLKVSEGRLMNDADEQQSNRVVILGVEAAQQLFPGKPAVGSPLTMNGKPYTVIGVLEKKQQNGSYGSGPDNTQLFVPYSSMARDFPPSDRPGIHRGWINNLVVEVADPEQHEEAIRQVYQVLGRRHHFEPTDKDAMTLLLGGIGVMNIMLVSVTERTREIGVRKALGATAKDIGRQFLAEAAILTTVSGVLGFIGGVGLCITMQLVPMPDFIPHPIISPGAIVASLMTLSVITIVSGMYPAQRAASLTPVECLRHE